MRAAPPKQRQQGSATPTAAGLARKSRKMAKRKADRLPTAVNAGRGGERAPLEAACESVEAVHNITRATPVDAACPNGSLSPASDDGGIEAIPSKIARTASLLGDRAVLMHFHSSCNGPRWRRNTGWGSKRPLGEWFGVRTSVSDPDRVIALDLNNNGLAGRIPNSIGRLRALRVLNLYDNALTGRIPSSICSLRELEMLRLGSNSLGGRIPRDIGALTRLRWLRLSCNELTGSIPPSIGRLSQVQKLYLYSNRLTGTIPSELGALVELRRLGLNCNRLQGAIPHTLSSLTQLTRLWLTDNPQLTLCEQHLTKDSTSRPEHTGASEEQEQTKEGWRGLFSCYSKSDVARLFNLMEQQSAVKLDSVHLKEQNDHAAS